MQAQADTLVPSLDINANAKRGQDDEADGKIARRLLPEQLV